MHKRMQLSTNGTIPSAWCTAGVMPRMATQPMTATQPVAAPDVESMREHGFAIVQLGGVGAACLLKALGVLEDALRLGREIDAAGERTSSSETVSFDTGKKSSETQIQSAFECCTRY